jgi:hypothetical protein
MEGGGRVCAEEAVGVEAEFPLSLSFYFILFYLIYLFIYFAFPFLTYLVVQQDCFPSEFGEHQEGFSHGGCRTGLRGGGGGGGWKRGSLSSFFLFLFFYLLLFILIFLLFSFEIW